MSMELACGHALKFEPTGDTEFFSHEIGHQKNQELIDAYNDFFRNIHREFNPSRVLEIGIWHGGSLALWREAWGECEVVGIDCEDARLEAAKTHYSEDSRITCHWFECPSPLLSELGDFDLVIDDGGHGTELVVPTFEFLWPRLRPGGFYIVEDWKPDFCRPGEMLSYFGDRIRGYWPAEDAGLDAPSKMSVYRGMLALERKK